VAIERAMSEDGRRIAKALRESVAGISAGWKAAAAAQQIAAVASGFDHLVEQYSADGLQLRASVEDLTSQGVRSTLIAIGASVAIALLITWALSFTIVPAVRRAAKFAEDIANGHLDNVIVLPKHQGRSETVALLGALARMQTAIRESLERSEQLRAEKTDAEQMQARLRKAEMCKFADDFERAVGDIVDTVSSASGELESSAGMLTATAERSQTLATMVTSASEEATTNVQSVASATEKMATSVNDISRQVRDSARIASEAVEQAHKTNDRVGALSKAASRIGDVVELINTIAAQTNLLALNATIEAARAGEAGRGFAVVASEVKALAQQTAKATEEISQQISGIQAATDESVAAIKEIGDTIGQMSDIASTIALTVEEQGAANQEISRNVRQAAQGTRQVSANISDVQRGAGETGSASTQVLAAAQSLAGESSRLKGEVKRFLDNIRAA
jgi:methyl-accepting chemotaxis protein